MHNFGFALEGAWQVLLAGLVLGAGLPALFALGIRATAFGGGGSGSTAAWGRPVGYLCFAIVVLAVLLGITFIVASGFGKTLDFSHIYPTVVDKH
ncbi:hypothetical protein Val02_02490 [Virgisporangium aliadipatigenens]|uniref:Transmembrane protein n=1 Tax=Virgisporangium aliadipatigenens TaxID=741659 RepID=A0A8J4DNA4_9ACTN|nr:hypothetical protein [Virgisporangium aliadipatigenens]GIJ43363.1 hypothetical protein Val02_02490 [Virgisporangium aliadipatigenens]